MYLTILFLASFFFVQNLKGQVDSTKLFYAPKLESGAFAELGSNFMRYGGESAMNIDISANWLVNHSYYLGAVYTQLASVEKAPRFGVIGSNIQAIDQQSVGVRFGYIILPHQKIISVSPDVSGGWSGIKWEGQTGKDFKHIGFITPAIKAVFNVSSYFRIGLAVNYQAYIGLDNGQFGGKQLNGVGGGVFLRLGSF